MTVQERMNAFLPHWTRDYGNKPKMRAISAFHSGRREGYAEAIVKLKSFTSPEEYERLKRELLNNLPRGLETETPQVKKVIRKKACKPSNGILNKNKDEVMQMIVSGIPDSIIGAKFNLTNDAVAKYRKRHGIPSYYQRAKSLKTEKRWEEVWRLLNEGVSQAEIGRRVGLTRQAISLITKTLEIEKSRIDV